MSELATDALGEPRSHPKAYFRRLEQVQIDEAIKKTKANWLGRATIYLFEVGKDQFHKHVLPPSVNAGRPSFTATHSLDFMYSQLIEQGLPVPLNQNSQIETTPDIVQAA